ncbi:MAG: PAS domain-containing sensor histidine kinase [Pseudomonadota bacterium]
MSLSVAAPSNEAQPVQAGSDDDSPVVQSQREYGTVDLDDASIGSAASTAGSKLRALGLSSQQYWLALAVSLLAPVMQLAAFMATDPDASWPFIIVCILHGALALILPGTQRQAAKTACAVVIAFGVLIWSTAHLGGFESPLAFLFVMMVIEALITRQARAAAVVLALGTASYAGAGMLAVSMGTHEAFYPNIQVAIQAFAILYALTIAARLIRLSELRDVRLFAMKRAINQFHQVTHDVFAIVRRDGEVHRVFGAVESVLGLDESSLMGDGLINRVNVADRPKVLSALDDVYSNGGRSSVNARIRLQNSDGSSTYDWVEIDVSSSRSSMDGHEIYVLIRDISAVKSHEAELLLAREKAEASDAAKGRFLATMSHELRTPLNAIIGFADMLDEEVFGPLSSEQQREYVRLIRDSGGHLLQMVNDLLDMSKLESGNFHIVAEPFFLEPVIKRCVRLLSSDFDRDEQSVELEIAPNLPELRADPRAVRQILINLLSNAHKFTAERGRIAVRDRRDGAYLLLSVSDNGIGISKSDLKRIGEPFFQAQSGYDRNHQGTGLGVSVVRGLCELHGGSFNVSSVEGEGTTVNVRLPIDGPEENVHDTSEINAQTGDANRVVFSKLNQSSTAGADAKDRLGDVPELEERQEAHG